MSRMSCLWEELFEGTRHVPPVHDAAVGSEADEATRDSPKWSAKHTFSPYTGHVNTLPHPQAPELPSQGQVEQGELQQDVGGVQQVAHVEPGGRWQVSLRTIVTTCTACGYLHQAA